MVEHTVAHRILLELEKKRTILDNHCKNITNSLAIINNDGLVKPCCYLNLENDFYDKWKEHSSIYSYDSLNSFHKSFLWFDLQERLNNSWISECNYCERNEKNNLKSQRFYDNNFLLGDGLEDLQVNLDFKCNMICRICRPGLSTKWDSKPKLIEKLKEYDKDHYNDIGNTKNYVSRIKTLLNNTNFDKLRRIRLSGGEPFLTKNLKWFLELLDEKIDLSKIIFTCNTNGSVFPDEQILKILKKFKRLIIDVSVDATEKLAESIRFGVKWRQIENNIKKWNKITKHMTLYTCVYVLNVNRLQDIINLGYSYKYMPLIEPRYLKHTQIPLSFRKKWLTTDDYVNRIIMMDFEPYDSRKTLTAIKNMDTEMNVFSDVNPEIISVLSKYEKNY